MSMATSIEVTETTWNPIADALVLNSGRRVEA